MVRNCLWKMSATPSACIKPGLVRRTLCHKVNLPSCVARRRLCHKVNLPSCVAWQLLYHKVNLPRCEARRRHLITTCNILGTGKTNTLGTVHYLWEWPGQEKTERALKIFLAVVTGFTFFSWTKRTGFKKNQHKLNCGRKAAVVWWEQRMETVFVVENSPVLSYTRKLLYFHIK